MARLDYYTRPPFRAPLYISDSIWNHKFRKKPFATLYDALLEYFIKVSGRLTFSWARSWARTRKTWPKYFLRVYIFRFFSPRSFVLCENWFRDFYRTYTIFIFIADNLICRSEYFWITCGGTHSRDVSWRRVGLTDWAAPVNFVEQFIVACTVFIIS